MYLYTIVREVAPGILQFLPCLAPGRDHIPRGWYFVCRRCVAKRSK